MTDGLAAGTTIGGYRITGEIGRGGMGVVYLAEGSSHHGEVALKVLPAELARQDDFRRRFQREANYAKQFQHPNIVSVHDVGEEGGLFYIAMEYVRGQDLASVLAAEGRLRPERAIDILSDVAAALDALHAEGLLHRDVKPGNILVLHAEDSQAKPHCYLTDFGLAKNPTQDSVALTAVDSFVGTLDYVAPELILNEEVDPRADVYSFACVLYECLAGQPPFGRTQGAELMRKHIQDTPPGLSERRPEVPAEIEAVVMRGLAKSPADRFASCGELIAAARAVLPAAPPSGASGGAESASGLRLSITAGPGQGREIRVEDELLIGRGLDGDGSLTGDAEISRRHARLLRDAHGAWAVEDLGSTNGTYLNGARVEGSPRPLDVGDTLQLGGTALTVEAKVPIPAQDRGGTQIAQPLVEEVNAKDALPVEPSPDEGANEDARVPRRVSLRVHIDPASREVRLALDESAASVRLVHTAGAWRIQPQS